MARRIGFWVGHVSRRQRRRGAAPLRDTFQITVPTLRRSASRYFHCAPGRAGLPLRHRRLLADGGGRFVDTGNPTVCKWFAPALECCGFTIALCESQQA
jgi:hypothetical protein